jgi:PAS domain S-box-containing protein
MNQNSDATSHLINSMSDYVSILDKDANFINLNHKQINIMGYRSNVDILGKTYYQFKGIPTDTAEKFIVQDQRVLSKNQPLRYLSYQQYCDGNWHLLLGDKNCILDAKGQMTGIFSQAKDITSNGLIDFSRFMFEANRKYTQKISKVGFNYILANEDNVGEFSKKEMVILFYLLRGKTAREMATIISRSEKTVNFHLDIIKSKYNVSSKSALIEKLIHEGFMNIIPDEVFSSL